MKYKSIFLYIYFLLTFASCTVVNNTSVIKDPPYTQFVKIYKNITVTRCLKDAIESSASNCETKSLSSTGSGAFVRLVKDISVVLTAGHVCDNFIKLPKEDKKYNYSLESSIVVQDHNSSFYNSKVILSEQSSKNPKHADLCSLVVDKKSKKDKDNGLTLETHPPKRGEDIYYMGAPMGIYHPPSVLLVKGVFSGKIDKISSLTTAPAAPGSSGSSVLSLRNRIYGVLFAVHPSFNTASVITTYNKTKNFLARTKKILELFILQQDDT
jgi:hypothetical protein